MAEGKLFKVTVQVEYYAYADDAYGARIQAPEVVDAALYSDEAVKAVPVEFADEPLIKGWNRESAVYNDDRRTYYEADESDMTLGALLDRLPNRGAK
jgi:hypothetical protein